MDHYLHQLVFRKLQIHLEKSQTDFPILGNCLLVPLLPSLDNLLLIG